MEKEVLQCILKKIKSNNSAVTILSVDSSPAVGKLRNFLSTVTRLDLKVVLGNGRLGRRSLVVKEAQCSDDKLNDFQSEYNVFKTETSMYLNVLKEMEYLMEEFGDTDGVLWCKLVHHIPYTHMVMDDLKAYGFSLKERTTHFNLDESLMAVNALGRYHGMSKIMEEKGFINKHDYKIWFVFGSRRVHHFWYWNMFAMIQGIKKHWGIKWGSLVDKINFTEDTLHEIVKNYHEVDESSFNILNHGDCNKNNIMFKHDWRGRPVDIRFLDFQMLHYGTPCCDLVYMLYLAVEPSVRWENYDLMLEVYHQSLTRTLDRFKYGGNKPVLQEIRDKMDRLSFIGLFMFVFGFQMMFVDEFDGFVDSIKMAETNGKEGFDIDRYKSEALQKLIGRDLEKFVLNFF